MLCLSTSSMFQSHTPILKILSLLTRCFSIIVPFSGELSFSLSHSAVHVTCCSKYQN